MKPNVRADSRRNYTSSSTVEHLTLGCLQRIADATELMARDRERMERELKYLGDGYKSRGEYIQRLERRNAALRGVITKLKRAAKGEQA